MERVNALIAQTIGTMITGQEIKDPRVSSLLSVTFVDVSNDLSFAKIGISGFVAEDVLDVSVAALNGATGYIQSRLGKVLKTRLTPKLAFLADHGIEKGFAMGKLLDSLVQEKKSDGTAAD